MESKKHKITFQVDICVGKDSHGYHAFCPALKGVHMDGETEEKAVENIKVAIVLYIKSLIKHHEPIPLQMKIEATQEVCSTSSRTMKLSCPPRQTQNVLVTV